ncbi:MAG: carboxymuconolactone decarboxylase [Gammaproteobacteria bacterium]|nr:MAG: carboxymuconolactone decarboxylase [Gammaproteobacteria bacterium]
MSNFTFYTPENSSGAAQKILTKVESKYGFVPNLFAYMAEAPYLIEAYAMLNELLAKTDLSTPHQQVALLAVSHYNNCEFCQVAHRAFGKVNKANAQTLTAIVENLVIEDASDKALVDMVVAMTDQRGVVSDEQISSFLVAGFSRRNIYDLVLIISIKTLSNYANHLTEPEPNEQLLAML